MKLKYSRQREAIKKYLINCKDHPTADIVYTHLRREYPNISLGTVYRNLALLSELGEITRISTGGNADHYDGDISSHQHFICNQCGKVYDLQLEEIDTLPEKASIHFPLGRIETCSVNFYGTCESCLKMQKNAPESAQP